MNTAHLHLIVNHIPIVGLLIGTLTLLAGFLLRKNQVKVTALGILVFSAMASIAAFYTGEGAEEVVEHLPGVSETLIHTHEEWAEKFFILTLIVGGFALIALILEVAKSKFAKYLTLITLFLAIGNGVLAKYVGTSGGEIRHSEIRNDVNVIQLHEED